jgi:hypothetical protein
MKTSKIVGYFFLVLLGLYALAFVITGFDFTLRKFWAPKEEQLRYDTQKESKAFRDGTITELYSNKVEYLAEKDEVVKAGLRSRMLHVFSTIDKSKLPDDLVQFQKQIEDEQVQYKSNHSSN